MPSEMTLETVLLILDVCDSTVYADNHHGINLVQTAYDANGDNSEEAVRERLSSVLSEWEIQFALDDFLRIGSIVGSAPEQNGTYLMGSISGNDFQGIKQLQAIADIVGMGYVDPIGIQNELYVAKATDPDLKETLSNTAWTTLNFGEMFDSKVQGNTGRSMSTEVFGQQLKFLIQDLDERGLEFSIGRAIVFAPYLNTLYGTGTQETPVDVLDAITKYGGIPRSTRLDVIVNMVNRDGFYTEDARLKDKYDGMTGWSTRLADLR